MLIGEDVKIAIHANIVNIIIRMCIDGDNTNWKGSEVTC